MKHPVRASLALLSVLGVQGCASAALGGISAMCDEPAVESADWQTIEHGGVRVSVPAELRTQPSSFGSLHFARNGDRVEIASVLSNRAVVPQHVFFSPSTALEQHGPVAQCATTINGYPVTIYSYQDRKGIRSEARWSQVTEARDLTIRVSARGRKDFERLRGVFWTVESFVQRPST